MNYYNVNIYVTVQVKKQNPQVPLRLSLNLTPLYPNQSNYYSYVTLIPGQIQEYTLIYIHFKEQT